VIDLHCHVLPFLDDGAADWQASLDMVRMAGDDGISRIVATPHWTGGPGETEAVIARADELRRKAAEAGLSLHLETGNEVLLVPDLVPALKEGRALSLGGSPYVLLETAQLERGAYVEAALFQLQSNGYRVILAHPERVQRWQRAPRDLEPLIERECYLQINAGSMLGEFGSGPRKAAAQFLRSGWASLLASDAHSPTKRPQRLTPALERCERIIGESAALALVTENPARVLAGLPLPPVSLTAPSRRGFSFPWSRGK
jgi:protein-tyrosine phosphatase